MLRCVDSVPLFAPTGAANFMGGDEKRKIVGVAILPKKAEKHLHSKLLGRASEKGITIKHIDLDKPLETQGHFDLILHKIRKDGDFEKQLRDYKQTHENVKIIDSVDAIRPLFNRSTMLQPLQGAGILVQGPAGDSFCWPSGCVLAQAPRQTVLEEGCTLDEAKAAFAAKSMGFPLVVKTMWSDGTEYCHSLGVVYNEQGLAALLRGQASGGLHLPLLFQQYVHHGGCLFKVYVLGRRVVMVKRDSLDIPQGQACAHDGSGLQLLERISAYPARGPWGSTDTTRRPCPVADPPLWLVEGVAMQLRAALGLEMFNFDVICPSGAPAGDAGQPLALYVLDINYFPGYEKLPGYEDLMVDFLHSQLEELEPQR